MTRPTWNDLCQLPTLTASSEKYKELVVNATTKLQQSLESALSALDQRAMALTKTANFDSALDDAKAMQQLLPRSALGYLREASIYSEQGKQRHVIDICNQALRIVDTKDVHYEALQQAKVDAEQRNNKRIDFISELPAEVTTTRFLPVLIDNTFVIAYEPCQYLHVSTVWRDCIIQHLDGLQFSIREDNRGEIWSQMVQLSKHTKSLHIDRYSKGTWLGDLLRDHDFCSLKEINFREFSSGYIDHFVSSLKSVSSTLTHLKIFMQSAPAFPIDMMISACPNLVSLHVTKARDADLSLLPMKPYSNLTTLSITGTFDRITFNEITGIWRRFPSLKHLQLHPCTDIQAALVVTDYYPSINSLKVTVNDTGVYFTCEEEGNPSEDIGITNLSLDAQKLPMNRIMNFNPILKHYHNTLERLDLMMDLDTSNDMIYTIQYPRLKRLVLHSTAWWIPQHAPMLQELALSSHTINMNPRVLDTTPRNLQKLELRLDMDPELRNKEPVERYLIRLAQQCQLKELTLELEALDNDGTLLDAIFHFQQLQSLWIGLRQDWACSHMVPFFDKLVERCPCLSQFEMSCKNTPSIFVLNTLKQFRHLQHFGFPLWWMYDNHDFSHWILNFSQLTSLRIDYAYFDKDNRIQHLKNQRPDMAITLDSSRMRRLF